MDLKEFIKPNKSRIILFVIVFAIISLIPMWPSMLCGSWECWPGSSIFWISLASLKNKEFYDAGYLIPLIYKLLISVFFAYLISTVIIKIKNK